MTAGFIAVMGSLAPPERTASESGHRQGGASAADGQPVAYKFVNKANGCPYEMTLDGIRPDLHHKLSPRCFPGRDAASDARAAKVAGGPLS
jgi:hypothetical protein